MTVILLDVFHSEPSGTASRVSLDIRREGSLTGIMRGEDVALADAPLTPLGD